MTAPDYLIDHADALLWLSALPEGTIDVLLTDPPYSSGGAFRGDRVNAAGNAKYLGSYGNPGGAALGGFTGDTRDQWGFMAWSALWLAAAHRASADGALALVFTDWRQIVPTIAAFQAGGWVYRGIIPWDKVSSRPLPGFAARCEFVVWGSKGPISAPPSAAGVPRHAPPRFREGTNDKVHPTQKPIALLRELLRPVAGRGVLVCDPFAGSGATAIAALQEGHAFLGCEVSPHYVEVARARVAAYVDGAG